MLREHQVEIVIDMWRKNKSGSEIGKVAGMTRSAVMGMVSRLVARKILISRKEMMAREPRPVVQIVREVVPKEVVKKVQPERRPVPTPAPRIQRVKVARVKRLPISIRFGARPGVTILNLENNMCRYIVDAPLYPDTYYCGDPKELGSYCAVHAEMCYYGPKRKCPDNAHDNPAQSDTAV